MSKQCHKDRIRRESVSLREQPFSEAINIRELSTPRFFSESEARLADIWQDVLGIRPASRNDHFFELGGDSLTAMQVLARVRAIFQVDLPILDFFATPTLGAMSHRLALLACQARLATPLLPVAPRDQPLPLSFSQERMWFIHQLNPQGAAYNVASVLRLPGRLNLPALQRTFDELVKRHESLRTTFPALDGQPVQVIATAI